MGASIGRWVAGVAVALAAIAAVVSVWRLRSIEVPTSGLSAQETASCTNCGSGVERRNTAAARVARLGGDAATPNRRIRIEGRIVVADWDLRPPRLQRFDAPVNPLKLGHTEETVLNSVTVTLQETGSTVTSSDGRFVLEQDLPRDETRVTLRLSSPFLMLSSGRSSLAIDVGDGDVDLAVPMIPAVAAQPRYNGRLIRPKDLRKAAVREEFERQMLDIARTIVPPPEPGR